MRAAVIAGGAADTSEEVKKYVYGAELLICCDSGASLCRALGVVPHIAAGDFDSADMSHIREFEKQGAEVITVPREKNFTDCELGLRLAIERGAEDITLVGCIGTRLDHTIANCHMLMLPLRAGIPARLVDSHNIVSLIDGEISLDVRKGQILSLIPLTTEVTGITTRGLYYPLENASLAIGSSRGISNVCTGEKAEVKISSGALLVILARD